MKLSIAKTIRIISVIASCIACVGMIWCTNTGNTTGVYVCMGACLVFFLTNMIATARENAKSLEAMQEEQQKEEHHAV